jgi:hypothetical protein
LIFFNNYRTLKPIPRKESVVKTLSALVIFVIFSATVFAQPGTLWTRYLGGWGFDQGYCVKEMSDNTYIISGATSSYGSGGYDLYLIKTDTLGYADWSRTFGGSEDDKGYYLQETDDGGYIIVGETRSFGTGSSEVYLVKTDGSGNELWSQTFGIGYGYWVEQTPDEGYIIAGATQAYGAGGKDVVLIKTDGLGQEEWIRTFGGSNDDWGYSARHTADGGYIITGRTSSYGAGVNDIYLVKTDAAGVELWTQTFGGTDDEHSYGVQQTIDGGYIIAGYTRSYGVGQYDAYLIKTNSMGQEQWSRTFGGDLDDFFMSVQQTSDGGFISAGYTYSYGAGSDDVYVVKTDGSGNQQWSQTYGGSSADWGYNVELTADGGYVIVGAAGGPWTWDIYLIRLGSETGVRDLNLPKPVSYFLSPAYPNPFNLSTLMGFQIPVAGNAQAQIFDIQGNVVTTLIDGWLYPGSYQIPFNASHLPSGIYIARFTAGHFQQTRKLVLVK